MRKTVFAALARVALMLLLVGAPVAVTLMATAHPALAQGIGTGGGSGTGNGTGTGSGSGSGSGSGDTLGSVIVNTATDLRGSVGAVVPILCGIIAIWLAYSGIVRLKSVPDHVPLRDPLLRLGASGAIITLTTGILAVTNGLGLVANDPMTAGVLSSSTSGTAQGIDDMMIRLISDIRDPMIILLRVFSFIAAIVFAIMGILRLIKHSENGGRGTLGAGTLMTLLMAGVFAGMGSMMDAVTLSMFGADGQEQTLALAYNFGGTVNDKANATLKAVLVFVQILGMISFVRGFLMLRAITDGASQSSMTAAFTHIFGGAIAANIALLVQLVQTTLGLSIVS